MASFAEIMVQKSLSQKGPDIAGAYAKGASIAIEKQKLRDAKDNAVANQAKLEQAKTDSAFGAIQSIEKFKEGPGRNNFVKHHLPAYIASLGRTEMFPEATLQLISSSPENKARFATLNAKVLDGLLPHVEAVAILHDAVKFADVTPSFISQATDKLGKSATTRINADAQIARTQQQQNQFEGREGRMASEEVQRKREGLVKELDSQKIPAMRSGFKRISKLIPGFLDGKVAGKKLQSITGIASQMPINWLKDENSEVRQAALGILNSYLNKLSGAAISDKELPRLAAEAGMKIGPLEGGGFMAAFTGAPSPEKFISGMRGIERKVRASEGQLKRAYGKDVYDEVVGEGTGGEDSAPGQEPKTPSINELDDPKKLTQLKKAIGNSAENLLKAAERYGVTPATMRRQLGIQE